MRPCSIKLYFVCSLALLTVESALLQAQSVEYSPKAEEMFRGALATYSAQHYGEAIRLFDAILREYPQSHRTTALLVMKGKGLFRLSENFESAKVLKAFLAAYPGSSFAADAHLTLGLIYERIGRSEEAMQEFIVAGNAVPQPQPHRLALEITGAMDSVADRNFAVNTLMRLLAGSTVGKDRAYFWLKVGEKEMAKERIPAALVAIDTLTQRYPDNPYGDRVAVLRSRAATRSALKLGALLPLMQKSGPSAMKGIGGEVFEGITYAVERFGANPRNRIHVTLEVRDSERDPETAKRHVREFAEDKDVVGIMGPVFSAPTLAAASVAETMGIPLITPTANANGIAAVGRHIFQTNADYEMRGRAMARFAVVAKGFTNLAVLAPSDSYGKFMAEGFTREAIRLGAKIVANEWYLRGAGDLKSQLGRIRRAGWHLSGEPVISFAGKFPSSDVLKLINLGVPVRRIDSLLNRAAIVHASALLGARAKALLDSVGFNLVYNDARIDSLEYPVTSIQAIYIPISSPDEIGVVSSQTVFFHFETQVLGSGEWNSYANLDANKRYSQGVIFESDTYIDSSSTSFMEFINGFSARFKKFPTRNTLYGYDTAQLVLSAIEGGAVTREALTRALSEVRDFRGLHSKIGFSLERVNTWLPILQYNGEFIQRLDEIHVE